MKRILMASAAVPVAAIPEAFEPHGWYGEMDAGWHVGADWTLGAAIDRERTNTATFADRIAWASLMRAPSQLYTGL